MPNYDAAPGSQFPPNSQLPADQFKMNWGQGRNYYNTPSVGLNAPMQANRVPKFSLLPGGGGAFDQEGNSNVGLSLMTPEADISMASLDGYVPPDFAGLGDPKPDAAGQWLDKGEFGLGVGKLGLGVYSALEAAKMNKFMRNYYGDQMDLQKADFSNAARSANTALEGQRERQLDSRGYAAGTDENRSRVDDYMRKHGVSETA